MRIQLAFATVSVLASSVAFGQTTRQAIYLDSANDVAVATGAESSSVLMRDGQRLLVSSSDRSALTWDPEIQIDDDVSGAAKTIGTSSVRIVGPYVFASWLDDRDGTTSIWFNHSDDNGATWQGAMRIDDGTAAGAGTVRGYRMEVTPGTSVPNVYLLVRVQPGGLSNDELRCVANDGQVVDAFLPAVNVSALGPQGSNVSAIDLSADGDTLHVAFLDNRFGFDEVWYQSSGDRGQTWMGNDLQITEANNQTNDSDAPLGIECDGSTVVIGWEEHPLVGDPQEIRAAVSTDSGGSFGAEQRVGEYDSTVAATSPAVIAFGNGNVSVAWQDARSGTASLHAATSTDGGTTWNPDAFLSPSGGTRARLSAAGRVGVGSWVSGTGDSQSAYSLDDGLSWKTITVSNAPSDVLATASALNPDSGADGISPNVVQAWVLPDLAAGVEDVFVGGYSACGPGTITNRTAGSNPQSFTATPAIMGGSFDSTVDLSTTNHPFAILVANQESLSLPLQNGNVLLINVPNNRALLFGTQMVSGPTANFSIPIPNNPLVLQSALLVPGHPRRRRAALRTLECPGRKDQRLLIRAKRNCGTGAFRVNGETYGLSRGSSG